MTDHFISLSQFSSSQILTLLEKAQKFSLNVHSNRLRDKIFVNMFYEPSTRTRCSFEIAAKRLGANIINFSPEVSSLQKGESIYDTLKCFESFDVDGLIIRHTDDYLLERMKSQIKVPMINGGAGKNDHPSQTLLDLLTLKQEFGKLKGLKIAICGDIKHSRVARSFENICQHFQIKLFFCGPELLLPTKDKENLKGEIQDFDQILPEVDAVMMLRIQIERHSDLDLNKDLYFEKFGLTVDRINRMKSNAIILHPGPFCRGVEIADSAIEHDKSRIFKQMSNGVFARMAILDSIIKGFS